MKEGGMKGQLERLREEALRRRVEFAEARFATARSSSLLLQDGRADRMGTGERAGMGVRVVVGGAWGFASTESRALPDWLACLELAIEMAKVSAQRIAEPVVLAEAPATVDEVKASYQIDPTQVSLERKLAAVRGYEEASACRAGERVANVMTGYSDARQSEMVCNTRGTLVSMESVRTMVWHTIIAQNGAIRQRGRELRGRQSGFELIEETPSVEFSVKAAQRAVVAAVGAARARGEVPSDLPPLDHRPAGARGDWPQHRGRPGARRAVHPGGEAGDADRGGLHHHRG